MKISVLLVNCFKRAGASKMDAYVTAIRRAARGLALAPEIVVRTDRDLPSAPTNFLIFSHFTIKKTCAQPLFA